MELIIVLISENKGLHFRLLSILWDVHVPKACKIVCFILHPKIYVGKEPLHLWVDMGMANLVQNTK
jgi:hypothetical protein